MQAAAPGFNIGATEMSLIILIPYARVGWVFGPASGRLAPVLGYTRVLRIMYAGTVNIVLNGLGGVHSTGGNPGFLPGMNAGAYNLGAGLSFLVLPAILVAAGSMGVVASYTTVVIVALVITAPPLASSLLIPKPVDAEVHA